MSSSFLLSLTAALDRLSFCILNRLSRTYGEGLNTNAMNTDGFSIPRPTIELCLDKLLNADSPSG